MLFLYIKIQQSLYSVYFLGNMTVSNELKELDRSKISNMTNFLTKYENMLGPNNHHVVEIKFAIVMMLGNRKPYHLENLAQEELELKERLAAQLIDLADKIEPGSSKWKGQLLLELQMAQVNYDKYTNLNI